MRVYLLTSKYSEWEQHVILAEDKRQLEEIAKATIGWPEKGTLYSHFHIQEFNTPGYIIGF